MVIAIRVIKSAISSFLPLSACQCWSPPIHSHWRSDAQWPSFHICGGGGNTVLWHLPQEGELVSCSWVHIACVSVEASDWYYICNSSLIYLLCKSRV